MPSPKKVDRRKYIKYAGAGIVGVTVAGAGYYLYGKKPQSSQIQTSPSPHQTNRTEISSSITQPSSVIPTVTKTGYQRESDDTAFLTISVVEARQLIDTKPKEDIVILDVRTVEEYHEEHIEDAVLIPLQNLQENIALPDKSKIIIVYCRTGGRSATASQILIDNGFTNVYNMDGGITEWINEGFPIIEQNGYCCE